jgi:hypothetical protein
MIKVQQAAHEIPQNKNVHAFSTAAQGHLLRLNCFLQPGVVGRTQRKPDTRVQPTSGIPWRQIKRHSCAGCLVRLSYAGDFRFLTARLLQNR